MTSCKFQLMSIADLTQIELITANKYLKMSKFTKFIKRPIAGHFKSRTRPALCTSAFREFLTDTSDN